MHFQASGGLLLQASLQLSDQWTYSIQGADPNLSIAISSWIEHYLQGSPIPFQGRLCLERCTPFEREALNALSMLPFGELISYGELGQRIGRPRSARAIGNVCHKNPYPLLIPCHRVIYANGDLGGFAYDLELKRRLIERERELALSPMKQCSK